MGGLNSSGLLLLSVVKKTTALSGFYTALGLSKTQDEVIRDARCTERFTFTDRKDNERPILAFRKNKHAKWHKEVAAIQSMSCRWRLNVNGQTLIPYSANRRNVLKHGVLPFNSRCGVSQVIYVPACVCNLFANFLPPSRPSSSQVIAQCMGVDRAHPAVLWLPISMTSISKAFSFTGC